MSGPDDRLRIGDAERERAQSALSDHYAAGRLDHDEYTERLDQIWSARTQADLQPVFADLPGHQGAGRRPPYSTPAARATRPPVRRGPRMPLPLLVLVVLLVVFTLATHLPLILIGVAVWFLLVKCGAHRPRRHW